MQGALPSDSFVDEAVEIQLPDGTYWRPSDDTPPSGAAMSLRDGLTYFKNTTTAQLMQTVGPAKVATLARAMGVRQSKLEEVPSLALGTSPVTLKEIATACATLANEGSYLEPTLVLRVADRNGQVLESFADKLPEQALSQANAQTLLDVMRGVIDRRTGLGIRSRYGIRADVAGKTGTRVLSSRPLRRTMRKASHKEGNKISDTGTAVITIKLCSLPMPLEPRDTSMRAVKPMATAQKARSLADGVSELDMDTEMT